MVLDAVIEWSKYLSYSNDDDSIDRLHYFFTSNILIALGILVSWKQFGGKPLECLTPAKFPGSWEQYTENYCWSQDTYFLPFDEDVPRDIQMRDNRRISYYQWVPFFLLIQAACFRLPSLIWKYLAHHSGINIHDIVKLAVDPKNVEPKNKKFNIDALTMHLQNALRFHRRVLRKQVQPHKILRILNIPYSAFFVTTMYLLTKIGYVVNVAVQLYALNWFLETDKYTWYGFGALKDLINGTTWEQTGVFPRVSLCDFQVNASCGVAVVMTFPLAGLGILLIDNLALLLMQTARISPLFILCLVIEWAGPSLVRVMGNVQRYSVQCVLVINIFNEKIFMFLWFWYVILFILTAGSLFYWLFVSILPCPKINFIRRHLELSDMPFDAHGNRAEVNRFVNRYLKLDGVFVLRMITLHSGVIFGTDLILSLWKAFYGIEDHYRREGIGGVEGGVTPTPPVVPPPDKQTTTTNNNVMNFLRLRKGVSSKDIGDDGNKTASTVAVSDSLTKKLLPPLPADSENGGAGDAGGGGGDGAGSDEKGPLLPPPTVAKKPTAPFKDWRVSSVPMPKRSVSPPSLRNMRQQKTVDESDNRRREESEDSDN